MEGIKYVLSHYPMIAWNGQFRNSVHLYGHVHSSGKDWEFPKVPNAYSVCCEFHDYTPVEINKFKPKGFKDEIDKLNKKEIPRICWKCLHYGGCRTSPNDSCDRWTKDTF